MVAASRVGKDDIILTIRLFRDWALYQHQGCISFQKRLVIDETSLTFVSRRQTKWVHIAFIISAVQLSHNSNLKYHIQYCKDKKDLRTI